MPSYVVLGTFTEQGVKDIKNLGSRLAASREQIEGAGGKLIAWYLTFGPYDFVAVTEVPSKEAGAQILLALGARGNVRTMTMEALTEEETAGVVAGLP